MANKALAPDVTCPVCGSSPDQFDYLYAIHSNLDGIVPTGYRLYRCRQCGMGMTLPQPVANSPGQYYRSSLYKKSKEPISRLVEWFFDRIQSWHLSEIETMCGPASGRLLDVGCGKGRFLAHAALRGWDAQGVEPSAEQAAAAREQYHVRVFEGDVAELDAADQSFRVVTAWHALEHISAPHEFMQQAHRILEPGGWLVLEVPNLDSWQARISRGKWFQLDAPWHVGHYSRKSLQRLFAIHGFTPVKYQSLSLVGAFGMLQSFLNCLGLPPNRLYNWLKAPEIEKPGKTLVLLLLGAALLLIPSAALEVLSTISGQSGGVIRVFARKG